MQIVYFSHSYRDNDQRVNDFFSRLMESEGILLSLDPPSETVNGAKLQRHLNSSDGLAAVLTVRDGGVSPFIRYEIGLCLRSRKPLLVFIEDVLPDGLVPSRVLQRRFSRTSFLRQVREHRHAVTVFKSYLGEEPPPRYQPEVSQRSCVIAGGRLLSSQSRQALELTVRERGYRVVSADEPGEESPQIETFAQADAALTFLDDPSPHAHYARGLIHGASVPTIELTAEPQRHVRSVPGEFWPLATPVQDRGGDELCRLVDRHLSLAEEDFLELRDQRKVEKYFRALVDIGSGSGTYSQGDHDQVVSVVMGDQYTVGQAGAVGPGSQAHDMSFTQTWNQVSGESDARALADDLARLRHHLRTEGTEPEQDVAIATLAEAEIEAKQGDGPAALERLSRLTRIEGAAKWVLGAATTIGTTVAAAALKAVLGV